MIVVASRSQVYGPFQDANEAMYWIDAYRRAITSSDLPLVIHSLVDPDQWGPEWRPQPRQLTTWDGKPTTLENIDKEMGYKPREAR